MDKEKYIEMEEKLTRICFDCKGDGKLSGYLTGGKKCSKCNGTGEIRPTSEEVWDALEERESAQIDHEYDSRRGN